MEKTLCLPKEIKDILEKYKRFELNKFIITGACDKFYVGEELSFISIIQKKNIGFLKPHDIQFTGVVEYICFSDSRGRKIEICTKNTEYFLEYFSPKYIEYKTIFNIGKIKIVSTKS